MTSRSLAAAAVLAATLVVACGSATSARGEVVLDGEMWEVLLATSDGMRGRTGFDGADGMLFDLDQDVDPDAVVFVMDGVSIALDIAWFTADGALVGTASMVPCLAQPCPQHRAPGAFRWAIEAPPGAFATLPTDATLEVRP